MTTTLDIARVETLVNPVLAVEGVEVVDLRYMRDGSRWVLRFFLDKEGGITLADCERLSRKIGALLDMEDMMPDSYSLEVSSPGMDRVLRREADFSRFSGKHAKLRLRVPQNGQRNFKGLLRGMRDGKILLDSEEGHALELPFADLEEARLDPNADTKQ